MKLLFLGTGGATLTPRPGCACRVCIKARAKGPPYSRWGPALFVLDENILFDTPDEISTQLTRAGIDRVDHVFYTHWHPDHTGGRRVLEHLNMNWRALPGQQAFRTTPVYLPTRVKQDFEKHLALMAHLKYFEGHKLIAIKEINDRETIRVGKLDVQAIPMANPSLYAYLLTEEKKRVLLALDDTKNWRPTEDLAGADLVVLETGWFEHDPEGNLLLPPGHPVRQFEASFEETLEILKMLKPKRVVLTHIEEVNARSYEDYLELEKQYREYDLRFAYDGLVVEV